ncbi:hypothetical protein TDB9533_00908 [Thalassocella blandensis]|nr:hypothetical protein TDB9533_00908 [Thalassocella blandensis]
MESPAKDTEEEENTRPGEFQGRDFSQVVCTVYGLEAFCFLDKLFPVVTSSNEIKMIPTSNENYLCFDEKYFKQYDVLDESYPAHTIFSLELKVVGSNLEYLNIRVVNESVASFVKFLRRYEI